MQLRHVLAVVAVTDLDRADRWYEALFGRPADNRPMPSLVEWQVTAGGWVQVYVDPERAGRSQLNLAVDDDLAAARTELAGRDVAAGEILEASKGVRLLPLEDPDGNVVTLLGAFREEY